MCDVWTAIITIRQEYNIVCFQHQMRLVLCTIWLFRQLTKLRGGELSDLKMERLADTGNYTYRPLETTLNL